MFKHGTFPVINIKQKNKMISSEQYISQTEHAVKSMFDSINHYSELIKMSFPPVKAIRHNGVQGEFERKYEEWRSKPEIQQEFEIAEYAREEYRATLFSMHVISGSILQIACKCIELYSNNTECDDSFSFLYEGCKPYAKEKLVKFAVGRTVRNVPVGLIIYAGRNQYNHLEEQGGLRKLNRNIFKALATNHEYGDFLDPPFDLDNVSIISYSSNIRSILDWDSYSKYSFDMKSLLSSEHHA